MKRQEYGETRRSRKHRKEYIYDLLFLKQSEKERKSMATNY